jgi:hypothetical protein
MTSWVTSMLRLLALGGARYIRLRWRRATGPPGDDSVSGGLFRGRRDSWSVNFAPDRSIRFFERVKNGSG